jgi:hypothetical protein
VQIARLIAVITQQRRQETVDTSKNWNVFDYLFDADCIAVQKLVAAMGGTVKPLTGQSQKQYSRFNIPNHTFVTADVVCVKVSTPRYYMRMKGEPTARQVSLIAIQVSLGVVTLCFHVVVC